MGERHVRIEISDFVMRTFVPMCSDVNRVCLKALQRPKQGIDLGFLCVPVSDEANDGAVVIV